jgi:hypothetical protein
MRITSSSISELTRGRPGDRRCLDPFEFCSNQFAIPAENGIGSGDARHLLQPFPSQTPADFRQRGPLAVRQPQARLQVTSQNPVLGRQILISAAGVADWPIGSVGQKPRPCAFLCLQCPSSKPRNGQKLKTSASKSWMRTLFPILAGLSPVSTFLRQIDPRISSETLHALLIICFFGCPQCQPVQEWLAIDPAPGCLSPQAA